MNLASSAKRGSERRERVVKSIIKTMNNYGYKIVPRGTPLLAIKEDERQFSTLTH